MLRASLQLASTVQYFQRSLLLLVTSVSDLSVRTINLCSVLLGVLVYACHKQDSLVHGGLRHKQTSTLAAINYFTVEIVDNTLPAIDADARYWSIIAIFAYPTCI